MKRKKKKSMGWLVDWLVLFYCYLFILRWMKGWKTDAKETNTHNRKKELSVVLNVHLSHQREKSWSTIVIHGWLCVNAHQYCCYFCWMLNKRNCFVVVVVVVTVNFNCLKTLLRHKIYISSKNPLNLPVIV